MSPRTPGPWRRFRADVGIDPLRLLVLLACLALCAYAFYRASFGPLPVRMLVWFVVGIVAHDLVLYPLYALADRTWLVARRHGLRHARPRLRAVPVVNYVRVPAIFSGILLLAFWGLISGEGNPFFRNASGHGYDDYLGRWLVVVGILFAVSAVLYALRLRRHHPAHREPTAS